MRTKRAPLVAGILCLTLPIGVLAQSLSDVEAMDKEERREYIQSMSPDERRAMREKWQAEFEQLPEDQQQAIRERRKGHRDDLHQGGNREAMRQHWDSMSEEERAAAREQRRAKAEERRALWESMSEEERAAAREKMGKRNKHKGKGHQESRADDRPDSGDETVD